MIGAAGERPARLKRSSRYRRRWPARPRRLRTARQRRNAFHRNAAPHAFDDALGDGKAKAGAIGLADTGFALFEFRERSWLVRPV